MSVFFILALLAIFAVLYALGSWAVRDALLRGKSPWLVLIAVVLFFPWGLVAWLAFRPDPVDSYRQDFNLSDYHTQ
jgi:hypothetical protein